MTQDRPGNSATDPRAVLSLYDYRRRVTELYAAARSLDPAVGHAAWRAGRDRLFATHPDSPVPEEGRAGFGGIPYYPYDPALRFEAVLIPIATSNRIGLPHSGDGVTHAVAVGSVELPVGGDTHALTVFRLDQYGDGLFLPFRDATNGEETYGGGRYLLDSAKGADLGSAGDRIVLDFNFAYHPSCVHDPRWSCPLSPPENRLSVPIRGGERLDQQSAIGD